MDAVIVIPRGANAVPCPRCGLVLHNLKTLGIGYQVGCACGAKVIVDRRVDSETVHVASDRRRGTMCDA